MAFNKVLPVLIIYNVLTVSVISQPSVGNSANRNALDENVNVTSTCGGVIADSRGQILYKVNETLLPNERCVWVIHALDSGDYDVYLDTLGMPSSLIISGFAYGTNPTTIIATRPDNFTFAATNLLVITLHTGPENNTEGATVYLFNQNLTSADKWQHHVTFCFHMESTVVTNRDLILLVFKSDRSNVSIGFHLYTHVNSCSIYK